MTILLYNFPLLIAISISFSLPLVSLADGSCMEGVAKNELSAKKILECVENNYSSFKTYTDSGIVKATLYSDQLDKMTMIKPFSTTYIKDENFRFEFKSKHDDVSWDRYIIWKKKESVLVWWDIEKEIRVMESLEEAVSRAIGVSSGSSHIIPALLLPRTLPAKWRLSRLNDLSKNNNISNKGVQYIIIQGKKSRGDIITIHINKSSLLIEKILWKMKFTRYNGEVMYSENVINYAPKANAKVAPPRTEFGAPSIYLQPTFRESL